MENLSKFKVYCQFGSQKRLVIFLIGLLGLPLSRAFDDYSQLHEKIDFDPYDSTDICLNATFDAALADADGIIHLFRGLNFWTLYPPDTSDDRRLFGPIPIEAKWGSVEGPIDAAFSAKVYGGQRVTYLFKGLFGWRFSGRKNLQGVLEPDTKQLIGELDFFNKIPSYLDAAFAWRDELIYFFKGTDYWAYNLDRRQLDISRMYPRAISEWGLPVQEVNAALSHPNGRAYFFVGDEYYRYDIRKFNETEQSIPFPIPYPRKTHVGILGCKDEKVAPGPKYHFYLEQGPKKYLTSSGSFLSLELLLLLICVSHNLKSSLVS